MWTQIRDIACEHGKSVDIWFYPDSNIKYHNVIRVRVQQIEKSIQFKCQFQAANKIDFKFNVNDFYMMG